MNANVYLLHGFNVFDGGKASTDTHVPYVRHAGLNPVEVDYGWVFVFGLRRRNCFIAKRLAAMVPPGSILVGHSNGCAIIYEACTSYGLTGLKAILLYNPALDEDVRFPQHCNQTQIYCFYNPTDVPVRWAVRWRKLVNKVSPLNIPYGGHLWGQAGSIGFNYNAPNLIQIDTHQPDNYECRVFGHSGVFAKPQCWAAPYYRRLAALDEASRATGKSIHALLLEGRQSCRHRCKHFPNIE